MWCVMCFALPALPPLSGIDRHPSLRGWVHWRRGRWLGRWLGRKPKGTGCFPPPAAAPWPALAPSTRGLARQPRRKPQSVCVVRDSAPPGRSAGGERGCRRVQLRRRPLRWPSLPPLRRSRGRRSVTGKAEGKRGTAVSGKTAYPTPPRRLIRFRQAASATPPPPPPRNNPALGMIFGEMELVWAPSGGGLVPGWCRPTRPMIYSRHCGARAVNGEMAASPRRA